MTRRTPEGMWPSQTIDEIVAAIVEVARTTAIIVSVGIDPGITGALAVLARVPAGPFLAGGVLDLPVVPDPGEKKKGRNALDLPAIAHMLDTIPLGSVVVLEKFMNIPAGHRVNPSVGFEKGQAIARGVQASNIRLSGTTGELRGLVAAVAARRRFRVLGYPTPQQWRKHLRVGDDKDVLRATARRLLPQLDHRLSAQTHHNRAEALLLAMYGTEVST